MDPDFRRGDGFEGGGASLLCLLRVRLHHFHEPVRLMRRPDRIERPHPVRSYQFRERQRALAIERGVAADVVPRDLLVLAVDRANIGIGHLAEMLLLLLSFVNRPEQERSGRPARPAAATTGNQRSRLKRKGEQRWQSV